jgi:hypothetical protein
MKCLLLPLKVRHFEIVFDVLECFVRLALSGRYDLWPKFIVAHFPLTFSPRPGGAHSKKLPLQNDPDGKDQSSDDAD